MCALTQPDFYELVMLYLYMNPVHRPNTHGCGDAIDSDDIVAERLQGAVGKGNGEDRPVTGWRGGEV